MAKKWLKKLGKGALAVSTGGASLAFKNARPNSTKPAPKSAQPMRPIRPTQAVNRLVQPMRPIRPTQAVNKPAQPMRPIRPTQAVNRLAQPMRPLRAVNRPSQPTQPKGEIVGYNPTTKQVIRKAPKQENSSGNAERGVNININIRNSNEEPKAPMRKVVDKKTGKPLVAQRAK